MAVTCATGDDADGPRTQGPVQFRVRGATATGGAFPGTVNTISPEAGDTMARARSRAGSSCIEPTTMVEHCGLQSITPSANVVYNEIWNAGRVADRLVRVQLSAADDRRSRPTRAASRSGRRPAASPFTTSPSALAWVTSIRCGRCRVPRPASTRSRYGRASRIRKPAPAATTALDAAGAVQLPAASLELTDEVSNEDALQLSAYRQMLFHATELELVQWARRAASDSGSAGCQWQPDVPPTIRTLIGTDGRGQCARLAVLQP